MNQRQTSIMAKSVAIVLVMLIIIAGIQFVSRERSNRDLVHYIINANTEGINMALSNGADPNVLVRDMPDEGPNNTFLGAFTPRPGPRYLTRPLAIAASKGNNTVVMLLLHAGAKPNGGGKAFEAVPLIEAVRTGNMEVVKNLLAYGADTRLSEGGGWDAISRSLQTHNSEIEKLILANTRHSPGADSEIRDLKRKMRASINRDAEILLKQWEKTVN